MRDTAPAFRNVDVKPMQGHVKPALSNSGCNGLTMRGGREAEIEHIVMATRRDIKRQLEHPPLAPRNVESPHWVVHQLG